MRSKFLATCLLLLLLIHSPLNAALAVEWVASTAELKTCQEQAALNQKGKRWCTQRQPSGGCRIITTEVTSHRDLGDAFNVCLEAS